MCVYVYVCVFVCVCMCMCVCVDVCICVFISVHTLVCMNSVKSVCVGSDCVNSELVSNLASNKYICVCERVVTSLDASLEASKLHICGMVACLQLLASSHLIHTHTYIHTHKNTCIHMHIPRYIHKRVCE
jgi:hypothetical protein